VTSPYYSTAGFNPATGTFTVPQTGRYTIEATINYSTTAALSLSLGPGINPAFVVRRTSPSTSDLIAGLFPVLNISVTLLTLRAVLGSGTVTLAGDVELNQNDVLGLFYDSSGLSIGLNLGGGSSAGIVWSIHQIA
jgi:hypothetical protein